MTFIDSEEVYKLISPLDLISAIEQAFREMDSDEVLTPQRMHINKDGNILLLMPCLTSKRFAVKLVTVYPDNTQLGLPALYGTVVLNDGQTGKPLAVIEGSSLTALRTAAVGAVGARYIVKDEINTLGIVGAGVQGFHQAWFIGLEKNINELMVFDPRKNKAVEMIEKLNPLLPGVDFRIASNTRELIKESQLIVTATTSEKPVIPDELGLLMKKNFIGIGSFKPSMRELPNTLYRELDQVWVDSDHAIEEAGDLVQPLNMGCFKINQVIPINKLINGEVELSGKKPTFFKSAGMALFDLVTADLLYEKKSN